MIRDFKVSMPRIQLLHPAIRDKVVQAIEKAEAGWPANIAIRVVQGLRTIEEQNALYNLGRTTVNPDGKSPKKPLGNIVTNAKGGSSFHNFGAALDSALLYDKDNNGTFEVLSWDTTKDADNDRKADWMEMVSAFVSLGFEWGGSWRTFKDLPHFQITFGLTWKIMLARYNAKDFIPGTKYIRLT